MNKAILILSMLLFTLGVFAQEASKKYVRTLDPQFSQVIQLEFNHPAEAVEWGEEQLRILVDVQLLNGSEQILEQLMLAGRYKISSRKEGEKFIVDIPGLKTEVSIGGVPLKEKIKAVVFVPKYSTVQTSSQNSGTQLTIQRGIDRELADRGLAAKGDSNFKTPFEVEVNISLPKGGN